VWTISGTDPGLAADYPSSLRNHSVSTLLLINSTFHEQAVYWSTQSSTAQILTQVRIPLPLLGQYLRYVPSGIQHWSDVGLRQEERETTRKSGREPSLELREGTTHRTGRSTTRDQTGSRLRGQGMREPGSRRWYTETVKVGPYSNYLYYGSSLHEFPKRDK
jgi:hypothetical protein